MVGHLKPDHLALGPPLPSVDMDAGQLGPGRGARGTRARGAGATYVNHPAPCLWVLWYIQYVSIRSPALPQAKSAHCTEVPSLPCLPTRAQVSSG